MARPTANLPDDSIEPALVYLRGAVSRGSSIFQEKLALVRERLAALTVARAGCPLAEGPALFNAWVEVNLTREGRARMLTALRRRRADANAPSGPGFQSLKLPAKTARELRSVARQAGMTVAQLLNAFVSRLQADASIGEQLRNVRAGAQEIE